MKTIETHIRDAQRFGPFYSVDNTCYYRSQPISGVTPAFIDLATYGTLEDDYLYNGFKTKVVPKRYSNNYKTIRMKTEKEIDLDNIFPYDLSKYIMSFIGIKDYKLLNWY